MLVRISKHYNASPDKIAPDQIKAYLFYCKEDRGLSNSYINQTISALKILHQDVLGFDWDKTLKIKRPRRTHHLPEVLSKQEVNALIEITANPKHKAIIGLLYSTGMRRDELIGLRISDIDADRMIVRVANGKGNKTRDTLLAKRGLDLVRQYYKMHYPKPQHYVFEGRGKPCTPYSATSILKLVKRATHKAGIKKNISTHSLRHAFATHMLEGGANLKLIQKLLGHSSLSSTMVYLHLSKIDSSLESPLDQL